MASTFRDTNGRLFFSSLARRLPRSVAENIFEVERDRCVYIVRFGKLSHGIVKTIAFPEREWLSDAMIARICLEAP